MTPTPPPPALLCEAGFTPANTFSDDFSAGLTDWFVIGLGVVPAPSAVPEAGHPNAWEIPAGGGASAQAIFYEPGAPGLPAVNPTTQDFSICFDARQDLPAAPTANKGMSVGFINQNLGAGGSLTIMTDPVVSATNWILSWDAATGGAAPSTFVIPGVLGTFDTNWHVFQIRRFAAGSVQVFIDGVLALTQALDGNFPNVAMQAALLTNNGAGTAAPNSRVDNLLLQYT